MSALHEIGIKTFENGRQLMVKLDRKYLKVAFFRKCDSFFKSPNFKKKNIPNFYPELEI